MTILLSIIGLGLIIFIHELGHFLVSLGLGMRPRRFYIGFPPAIWKTNRNGIEYGVGAIPLGGFVKITMARTTFAAGPAAIAATRFQVAARQ